MTGAGSKLTGLIFEEEEDNDLRDGDSNLPSSRRGSVKSARRSTAGAVSRDVGLIAARGAGVGAGDAGDVPSVVDDWWVACSCVGAHAVVAAVAVPVRQGGGMCGCWVDVAVELW